MHTAPALLLLSIAFTACASASPPHAAAPVNARSGQAHSGQAHSGKPAMGHAASRLGPPSPRGLGLRRIDRPLTAQAPLALY
ncbi:MAG TPA: hypothetical protein VEQ59_25155 [Polyangiaceae bacterium]|nr:hypothetical protein [Polyangiaceae bacterium]